MNHTFAITKRTKSFSKQCNPTQLSLSFIFRFRARFSNTHSISLTSILQKNRRDSNKDASSSSPSSSSQQQPQQRSSIPEHLRTEDEQRRFLKSILPSTVVAASAHPDHAAKVMDHPLPAMRLTAKKIPTAKLSPTLPNIRIERSQRLLA